MWRLRHEIRLNKCVKKKKRKKFLKGLRAVRADSLEISEEVKRSHLAVLWPSNPAAFTVQRSTERQIKRLAAALWRSLMQARQAFSEGL